MKIIPNRNMFLDGRRVVNGEVETVSQKEGELAVRHGWAKLPDGTESTLTVAEIQEKLKEANIEFNPKAKKAELLALLPAED